MRALVLKSPRNLDERDANRCALNEAADSRRNKRCQDEMARGNGKAGHNGHLLHVLI